MADTDLLTREQMAHILLLSPNRLSELTRAGHIQATTVKPLRYDRQHAAACYSNYKRALAGSDREYFNPDFLRRIEAQAATDADANEAS